MSLPGIHFVRRHSGEGRNPVGGTPSWIPAFAGMTCALALHLRKFLVFTLHLNAKEKSHA
jgi:hypothetical protein